MMNTFDRKKDLSISKIQSSLRQLFLGTEHELGVTENKVLVINNNNFTVFAILGTGRSHSLSIIR